MTRHRAFAETANGGVQISAVKTRIPVEWRKIIELRTWYRHPDQEFLRREVGWTLHWLFRGSGRIWLGIYAVLAIAITFYPVRVLPGFNTSLFIFLQSLLGGTGNPFFMPLKMTLFLPVEWLRNPHLAIVLSLWVYLVHRRSLAPFGPGRMEEMLSAPIETKRLWPALLAAPIVAIGCLNLIRLGVQLTFELRHELLEIAQTPLLSISPFRYAVVDICSSVAIAVQGTAIAAALTALTAYRRLPKPSVTRIAISGALGYLIFVAASAIAEVPVSFGWKIAMRAGVLDFLSLQYLRFGVHFVVTTTMAFFVWKWFLRRLQSDKMWAKLRAAADCD